MYYDAIRFVSVLHNRAQAQLIGADRRGSPAREYRRHA